jgi:SAM-dependent methyltransferase
MLTGSGARCPQCSSNAEVLHRNLSDRLYGCPGTWTLQRCNSPGCGLIWIDPQPDVATQEHAYARYYTHSAPGARSFLRGLHDRARSAYLRTRFGYDHVRSPWWATGLGRCVAMLPHRRAALDASVLWLPWRKDGHLLEIGCGDGARLELLQSLGWVVSGVEPDAEAAAIARSRGIPVVAGPLRAGEHASSSLDAVLMCHVIEHLPDAAATLDECRRILKPGGVIIALTPNSDSLGHRWYGRSWLHLDPPRHIQLFNSRNMRTLFEACGFSISDCRTTVRDANWTFTGSRTLRRNQTYRFGEASLPERMIGLALLYFEWFAKRSDPLCGEDLLVIAHRPESIAG